MTENNKKLEEIDFFEDNRYDINKFEDINYTETINILEKNNKYVSFELGGDFFKCFLNEDNIIQYPDFVSLRDEKQNRDLSELTKNINDNDEKLLYLTSIKESIKSNEVIKNLNNYTLKDRENYIKKDLKDVLSINAYFNLNKQDIKDIIKKAKPILQLMDTPELNDLKKLSELAITTIAVFSLFYKNIKIRNSKNDIINNIITNFSNKNSKTILNNKEIKDKCPELDNIMCNLEKFNINLSIDNGIRKNTEKIVSEILNNEKAMSLANKLSETNAFQNFLKENNKNFINVKNIVISGLDPKLMNELLSNNNVYLKDIFHEIDKPFEKSKFMEVFSELNLSPTKDAKNFCTANEILNDLLNKNNNSETYSSINQILSHMNLENIDSTKILNIVESISKKILGLDINNKMNIKRI